MKLRELDVMVPAWNPDGTTKVREPRVRDFLAIKGMADEQERTVILLGSMVLDDKGEPVGKEAILDASFTALAELTDAIEPLLKRKEKEGAPLTPPSD